MIGDILVMLPVSMFKSLSHAVPVLDAQVHSHLFMLEAAALKHGAESLAIQV